MKRPDIEAIQNRIAESTDGPWTIAIREHDENNPESIGNDTRNNRTAVAMCP